MAKGKGKYAAVIGTLPRNFGEDPSQQEKINAIKAELLRTDGEPAEPRISSEVIEDLTLEVAATLKVLNDGLIRPVGDARRASDFARIYRDVRKLKTVFDQQEKETNVLIAALEQIIVEQYEAEGVTSLKLEDGDSVRFQEEPHCAVIDKVANRKWAQANGLEDSLALPWQTLNAISKEALLKGEEPPDGVEISSRPKVVYTK